MATVLEIVAYYVPWLDNLLDTIAIPAAIVAGTVLTAGFITDMSPVLRWALAIVAGGGAAAITQGLTTGIRAASSSLTAGIANPLVSTAETGTSTIVSVLTVVLPVVGIGLTLIILLFLLSRFIRRRWLLHS